MGSGGLREEWAADQQHGLESPRIGLCIQDFRKQLGFQSSGKYKDNSINGTGINGWSSGEKKWWNNISEYIRSQSGKAPYNTTWKKS